MSTNENKLQLFMHHVWHMKSLAFKTKSLLSHSHVGHSNWMGWPNLDMLDLNYSNVDLFMYLIEGIRIVHEKFNIWSGPNF